MAPELRSTARVSEAKMAHQAEVTKKACRCGHGVAIHKLLRRTSRPGSKEILHPCNHPGCHCGNYISAQRNQIPSQSSSPRPTRNPEPWNVTSLVFMRVL